MAEQDKTPEAELTPDQLWEQAQKDRKAEVKDDKPEVEAKPEAAKEPDPLDGLPEPTRKLIEGLQARVNEYDGRLSKVGQQLATAHGTIGNLKQRLDASQADLGKIKPTVEAVEAQKKAEAEAKAAEKQAKKKELRENLSDLSDMLEYVDMEIADAKPAKPEQKPEEKKETKPVEAEDGHDDATVARLLVALHEKAPGWKQKRDSREFQKWLPAQSAEIKRKAESWDIDEAASVFTAFDKHIEDAEKVAKVEAERAERLRRGENVQGRGSTQSGNAPSRDDLWEQAKRDREKARASA